jgi:hypothetical protein
MRKANLPGKRVLSVLAAASMILAQAGSSAFPTFASETENETTQTTEEIATETEPQETVTVPQTDAAVETEAPTTAAPETEAPTTAAPETEAPQTTAAPATEAETEAPQTTEAPTTATQETTPEPTLAPVYQLEAEDGEFSLTLQYKDGHAFAEGRSLSVKRQNDLNAEDTELPEKMLDDIQAFLPYEISLYDQGDGTVIPVDLTADHSDYIAEIRVPQQWLTTEEERDLVLLTWNKDLAQYETTILQEGEEYQTAEQKMEIRNDAESGETVIEYTGELPQIFTLLVVDKDWQVEETETAEAETTEAETTEAEATEAETEVSGEAEPEESSTEVESEEESTEEVTSEAETTEEETTEEETTEEETTEEETTEEETTKEATARHQARRRVNSIPTGDEIDFSGAERVSTLEEKVSGENEHFDATIVVTNKNVTADENNIFQFKTDEGATMQFGISNTNNNDDVVVRIYLLFDGDSLENLGIFSTPNNTYQVENSNTGATYPMTLVKTDIAGLYYYEITGMGVSETVSFNNSFTYPSPSSAGGSMRIWLVAMSQEDAASTDKDTIHNPSGEYMEFHWTTDPNTFTLAESYNSEGVSAYMDGSEDDTTIYIKNVKYKITLSCGTDTGLAIGEDYVVSADYEQAMVFPDNVGWNETILNAIKNNTITWVKTDKTDEKDAYYTVYAGDQVICTLSGDENITSISFRWDEEEERVYLEWTVSNPATDATGSYASSELPLNALTLTFDDKAFRVENADLLSDTETSVGDLNSDVKVTLNYSHQEAKELTATAGDSQPIRVLTGLAMKKTVDPQKQFDGSGSYVYAGADVAYTIQAWNQGLANYTKLNGGTIEDTMQKWFYIKNQNIDAMFADTYGEGLTITIYPATLCTPVSQTTIDAHGNTITLNAQSTGVNIPYSVSSSDSSATTTTAKLELSYDAASQCIVLKKMDDGSTVSGTYTIGANGTYATTADAMNAIGYVITSSVQYKLSWKVDQDLRGGEELIFTIPANSKDTTMLLTYDEPNVYSDGGTIAGNTSNTAVAMSADGTSLANATSNSFSIQAELRLFAEAAVNGGSYSDSVSVSDGDVVDYKISFNNRSSYENLPIVDSLTGGQVLLVEKQLNAGTKLDGQSLSAAGVETVTIDGVEYYRLSKAGTYTGVKLGNGYQTGENAEVTSTFMVTAGEVTVSESDSGLNTVIKTYFANQKYQTAVQFGVGQNARIYVTFKTQADSSVVSTVNEDNPSFSIGSTAWAGDHQTHRLYTTTTGGGSALSFAKYIREEEDTGAESLVKRSTIREGDNVVYEIVIQNNGSSTMNLTGNRIYDALPSTAGTFAWSTETVTEISYQLNNATCTTTSGNYWYIDQIDPESGATMDQYYIHWTNEFSASINGGGSLTIVVNCVYPDNDGDEAVWDAYVKANNGADLTNIFYLDSHASDVTHELADTGKVILRKGVFDTFWTWGSWLEAKYLERGSRLTYENGLSSSYSTDLRSNVMYYTVLYNGGTTRLYLDKIYDILPEGFSFSGMYMVGGATYVYWGNTDRYGATAGNGRIAWNADTESLFSAGDLSNPNNAYHVATVVDPDREVEYMNVNVKASASTTKLPNGKSQQIVTFSFGEIGRKKLTNEYDPNYLLQYDEEKQMYYLEPGQAIRFGYLCCVGPEATTADIATNTVAMPYLDYNETGVIADDYEKVVVHEQAGMISNDGGCDVISSDEAAAYGFSYSNESVDTSQWLTSSVNLTRGTTVPGIQKSVGGVTSVVTNATEKTVQGSTDGYGTKYSGMTTANSVVNWKLRIFSESELNGGNTLVNYTVTDTMDAPYAFTGQVRMDLYTSAGQKYTTFNLFTLGSRTQDDTEVAINTAGSTDESNGNWTKITVNGDAVKFASGNGTVQLLRDETGKETLVIKFISNNYGIPDGWYADLCLHTMYNKDGAANNSPFYNEVLLTTESSFDASLVSHGRVMDEADDGTATTLRSGASIMLGSGYATSAVNKIDEIANRNNNATSDADTEDGTWIMLQNKESEFTYHLIVTTPDEKALKELVVINQLPEEDDHSAYVDANMRESEFTVSLTEDPNFTVEIYSDETGELLSTLSSDKYKVYLSEKTRYTSDDWNGSMDGWTEYSEDMDETKRLELLAKARSVRVIITDETLSLMPADSEIKISFNSKVDDENAEDGMIAWSSFGYKYTVMLNGTAQMSLKAEPLKVGVKIPATPVITKTLETTDGETYVTEADQTFEFLIYNGTVVNGVSSAATVAEKIQLLEAAGKKYTCATVTVPAGSSEATSDSLNNLSVYSYENDALTATDEEWVWDNNANYTITELPCTNGYAFGGFNAGKADTNTYTFKQSSSTAVKIAALNTHDPREVEAAFTLTKNLLGELSEVQFAFSVKEVDGTTLKEVRNAYTGKIYNGTADAEKGVASFKRTFQWSDLEMHYLLVSEVENKRLSEGVDYVLDTTEYLVGVQYSTTGTPTVKYWKVTADGLQELSLGTNGETPIVFNNTVQPGRLNIEKYGTDKDADGNKVVLSGVVFGIYDSKEKAESAVAGDGNAVEELTTDENGTAVSKYLDYGKYWVKELSTPTGYQADTTIYGGDNGYTVGKDSRYVTVTVDNVPLTGKLALTKYGTDQDASGNDVTLSGAVFGIFTAKSYAEAEDASIDTAYKTITTGTNGYGESEALAYGTYWVKELVAPTGYQLDDTVYGGDTGFTVGKTEGTDGIVTITVNKNVPKTGTLTLTKYGTDADADNNKPVLSGAVFGIYATEDLAKSGTADDTTALEKITTGTDGTATTSALAYGTYWVKELTAPTGYQLDATPRSYTVGKTEGTNGNVSATWEDTPLTGKLALTKYGTDVDANNNKPVLSGAVFGIFDTKAAAEAETATAYATITTGTNGYGESEALAYGTYWVKELTAPTGYQLDDTVYGGDTGFTVGKTEGTNGVVTVTVNDNVPSDGVLTIGKKDAATGENLSGAVYTVYTDKDCTTVQTTITVTNGVGSATLPYGTYYIKETTAPKDYRLDQKVYGPYAVGKTKTTVTVDAFEDEHKLALPTGIRMDTIPYLLIALSALVFLVVIAMRAGKKGRKV